MSQKHFYEESFNGKTFSNEDVRGVFFEVCTFTNCSFSGVNFIDTSFEECDFNSCDFSGAFLNETALREVDFISCKMIGLSFEHLNPFGLKLRFKESILDYSTFYNLSIPGTSFENSSLKESDFTSADLSGANFANTDLSESKFERTNLSKADFRGASNYRFNPSENRIKGAQFSQDGIMGLLQQFDIRVE